jgi:hypothetical protein
LPVAFIMGINDGFTGDKIGYFTEYQMMSGHIVSHERRRWPEKRPV